MRPRSTVQRPGEVGALLGASMLVLLAGSSWFDGSDWVFSQGQKVISRGRGVCVCMCGLRPPPEASVLAELESTA